FSQHHVTDLELWYATPSEPIECRDRLTEPAGGVSNSTHAMGSDPIAIVGMAVRLPGGVRNTSDFWDMLINKKSGLTRIPKERWDNEGFYSEVPKWGTIQNKECYLLSDVDLKKFDTSFFTCGQQEAERMDPMQRQLLEITRECLDSAGETFTSTIDKQVGCYVGTFSSDWQDDNSMDPHASGVYRGSGYFDFFQANRISYEYNWTGPSMVIKTGCSSAMVALHLAVEAVQSGACTTAMALGCNLITSVLTSVNFTETGILSPSGKCKTFDVLADGYGRGEAVNAVYVKKLSDAIRDSNPIRAVIRASATNNDGRARGIMTPNDVLQERLIRQVYAKAGISDLSKTAFFECHGTGTPTGDPLEASAVARVWGPQGGILMGAVKPNVGHSEGAAGLTSVIKAVLALENRTIPPNIYLQSPNPKIPWEAAKLRVPTEPESWPEGKEERISVNSFGVSGSNAHVILESYSHEHTLLSPDGSMDSAVSFKIPGVNRLLLFSAAHPESLEKQINQHREYLYKTSKTAEVDLDSVSYTLALHREHLGHRAYAIVDEHGSFDVSNARAAPLGRRRIVFVYTGQGVHWAGMGKTLMDANSVFRAFIQKMDAFLHSLPEPPSWTIEGELQKDELSSLVGKRGYSHPCATAVQLALTDLLFSLGVRPDAVTAHSGGEAAAAYATGAISAEQAMAIAYFRGWVLVHGDVPPGAMAAVSLGPKDIEKYLIPGVVVGCENSPMSLTLSGDPICIQHCVDQIARRHPDVKYKVLDLETSFHSPWIEPLATEYAKKLRPYLGETKAPCCPHFSSVTGKAITTASFNTQYWVDNLVLPVRFDTAVRSVLSGGENNNIFIEVGPHPALQGSVKEVMRSVNPRASFDYVVTLKRREDSKASLLRLAGELFTLNVDVDLRGVIPMAKVLPDLPSYPWHHAVNYMFVPRTPARFKRRHFPRHALLGSPVLEGTTLEPAWRNMLDIKEAPWLFDHVVNGSIIFPAAAYLAMAGEAMRQVSGGIEIYSVRSVKFSTALSIPKDRRTELYTRLIPEEEPTSDHGPWCHFKIMSSSDGDHWVSHCTGLVSSGIDEEGTEGLVSKAVAKVQGGKLPRKVDVEDWYAAARKMGTDWGPAFQGLDDISAGTVAREAVSTVYDFDDTEHYAVHPTILDQLLQIILVAMTNGLRKNLNSVRLPTNIRRLQVFDRPDLEMRAFGEQCDDCSTSPSRPVCQSTLLSLDGKPSVVLEGFAFAELPSSKKTDRLLGSYFAWDADISMVDSVDDFDTALGVAVESQDPRSEQLSCLCRAVSLFGWKYPDAHVLEVGDGNLEVTKMILEALHPDERRKFFSSYTYACIAEDLVENAMIELADREGGEIAVISAEEIGLTEPVDLIVMSLSSLLDAAIREELEVLPSMIHPWGRVLVHHVGDEEAPARDIERAAVEIEALGFTTLMHDTSGLICAHAKQTPAEQPPTELTIVASESSKGVALATAVGQLFEENGWQVDIHHNWWVPAGDSLVIVLRDLDEPAVYNLDSSTFRPFMDSICSFKGQLIWATPSAHSGGCKDPRSAMIHGTLRTIHMEYKVDATVVEVNETFATDSALPRCLWSISQSLSKRRKTPYFDPDVDFAITDGIIQVPRMHWFGLHDEGLSVPGNHFTFGGKDTIFRPDVTYLLVGGMGGIGRCVAIWMAEKGARSFVFLSRSATSTDNEEFRREIASYPECVAEAVSGDVAEYADVMRAVEKAPSPIAGVFQLSLVLRDNATAQMTYEEWQTVVKPRVHGTWNLHQVMLNTRSPLDFFVIFGSGGGFTGYYGQANYSASNTYLDAFVAYRRGLGLPASILDIGVVGDVGYFTANEKQYTAFKSAGYVPLSEQDVLDAVAVAVAHSNDRHGPFDCFLLGALSDLPFDDPANRLSWKRDVRCALSRHLHDHAGHPSRGRSGHMDAKDGHGHGDSGEAEALIALAKMNPDKISDETVVAGLANMLSRELSRLLLRPLENFAIDSELISIGLDSIVSIELVDWIQQKFRVGMSSIEITQCSSLMHLAGTILGHLAHG
ncbi:polyketide synthase, partial [Colletotrichum musicola]